ncbi:MAG TPA: FAD:protein FMN transferase [Segeticoccus sp.]|uniref:FAD:protein FMN transferase n=1 Tax=Segeticoccus sp. TaxID=2706531 RepID=UPI002D810C3D|nr:FAD:protein FMN transferase [Segeticoccus sp.]HET8601603.1 FAD:protein FMN transferase [Segeticoccus sp.]
MIGEEQVPAALAADSTPALRMHRAVEHVMGMPISLALRGRHADDQRGRWAWAEALAILREADRVFSTYRPGSCISRLGRGELTLRECPAEVADVLALGEQARAESGGAFDIWRRSPGGERVFDPSGVVKGWAVERAARRLASLPETDFCLCAGGDMVCHVADPEAAPWRIGVEDPHHWDRVVAVIPVWRGAVATSGLNRRGAHITDARTGAVPAGVASVTVVADSLTWADIDATAAFAQGEQALSWLAHRPGRRGVVVWADGSAEVYDSVSPRDSVAPR